jgi:hypothetical protein
MTFLRSLFAFVSCAILCTVCSRQSYTLSEVKTRLANSKNQCIAKGGIGLIDTSLSIITISPANELLIAGGIHWQGESASVPQLVVVRNDSVILESSVTEETDFSNAIAVSFESDTIRFFDAKHWTGGYYVRTRPGLEGER